MRVRIHETASGLPSYPRKMRRKTPQEKKRLSLEKNGRNAYGENDKSSRKNIPRAKSRVNRANRRADSVALSETIGVPDDVIDAAADDAVKGRRRKFWRKVPDQSLGHRLAERNGSDDTPGFDPSRQRPH